LASITVVTGPNEGDYYTLGTRSMVIGRDEGATVQLNDELVSRKHCQIRCEGEGEARRYVLLDLRSANGTGVNGRTVTECDLREDDIIEIGNSRLLFSLKEFDGRENAMNNYKKRGERQRSTMVR